MPEQASAQAPAQAATPATHVPVEKFGKDHWSALAYAEAVCVDGRKGVGRLDRTRLRCNKNHHPMLLGVFTGSGWQQSWGTRLTGFFEFNERSDTDKAIAAGFLLGEHDDWDCLADLEAAGFLEVQSQVNGFVTMTKKGVAVAAQLRAHKASGGQFAGFSLAQEETAQA